MVTIPDILLDRLTPAEREVALRAVPEERLEAVCRAFGEWGHEGQLPPSTGDWRTWVLMAGRGFGKTRAGAEWVLSLVRLGMSGAVRSPSRLREGLGEGQSDLCTAIPGQTHPRPLAQAGGELRVALVAATVDEARRVMVEGPSGLLACAREGEIADWSRSRGELVFAGGAVATLFSGANPESLRGPQHHFAWCDELAKWRHADEAWDMLQLGLRCGPLPRALVTTTPRGGCGALARILEAKGTVLSGGRSGDNPHLPAAYLDSIEAAYGGTRMGREEIDGEFLRDVAGTLWPAALIEASRGAMPARAELVRVVIGVDPPASAEGTCGIVACGVDAAGVAHVLGDHSAGGLSPEGWARKVAAAAEAHDADRVVVEKNQGGDMVTSVLRACFDKLSMSGGWPVTPATASASKAARAEPVAGLFECGKARLAGRFPELEAELGGMVPGKRTGPSPDRADAMVWALWALMLAPRAEPRVRVF